MLEQFALELLIGAAKNSDWFDGKFVIDANHGPIHLLQAAFYAVKLEVQRGTKLKSLKLKLTDPPKAKKAG